MSKEIIPFEFEAREAREAEIAANGWRLEEIWMIDLDPALLAQDVSRPTNCWFVVETEPPEPEPEPETADMQGALATLGIVPEEEK